MALSCTARTRAPARVPRAALAAGTRGAAAPARLAARARRTRPWRDVTVMALRRASAVRAAASRWRAISRRRLAYYRANSRR